MADKFYAVRKGKTPGIYSTWNECKYQIEGVSGAEYKKFSTLAEAEQFMNLNKTQDENTELLNDSDQLTVYVDGSFTNGVKKYGYGCAILHGDQIVEISGSGSEPDMLDMRNVAGEIKASEKAICWAIEHGYKSIKICYDYEGVEKWATGVWQAKKPGTQRYVAFIKECRPQIQIRFEKIRAHSGNKYNDLADFLAKSGIGLADAGSTSTDIIADTPPAQPDVFEMFGSIMFEPLSEKENAAYTIDNFILNDARVKKFIKEYWAALGNKKTDVTQMTYAMDLNKFILITKLTTKDGVDHDLKIEIK